MKLFQIIFAATLGLLLSPIAFADASTNLSVQIEGPSAKKVYKAMTGPAIQNEGAAGHQYRQGKNILCQYTDVDMDDSKGKSIPNEDPRRYSCTIQFDSNGAVLAFSKP